MEACQHDGLVLDKPKNQGLGYDMNTRTRRVHVGIWYILGPESRYMGTALGPKYIPYTVIYLPGPFGEMTTILIPHHMVIFEKWVP